MWTLSVLLLCLTAVVSVSGLICQFPHCDKQICPPVTECPGGEIKMGGGYCGCCLACFITLGEFDACEYKDPVDAIMYPSTRLCGHGLYCSQIKHVCLKSPMP